jgi:predicted Zn-dependent protease
LVVVLFFVSIGLLLPGCATTSDSAEDPEEAVERVRKENEVGEAALAKLAGAYGVVRQDEATRYLNLMLKSLALYVERQELQYNAGILATEQVNAFALPGGFVLVNLGTLRQIRTPGELAGILAHELGHVNHKHILENVTIEVEQSFAETLARLLSGSRQVITSAMGQINEQIEERLFIEGYASEDEFEADRYAVELLQAVGLSARPYYEYLQRLSAEQDAHYMENLDQTHPSVSQRLDRIKPLLRDDLPDLPVTPEFTEFMSIIQSVELPA